MNWDIPDLSPEQDNQGANKLESIHQQNEEKRLIQLKKFQDPNRDQRRKAYIEVMSHFGKLIVEDKKEEIVNTLLAKDCEIFLFNSRSTDAVQYAFGHEGFIKLFKDLKILKREVKETNTSLRGATGFQICYWEILDENKGPIITKFSYETFSFVNDIIAKYTATYGSMPIDCDIQNLFMPTRKEIMLAKIKELNYAWADQPDLDRIGALLHENTEYKVWRWKDNKCCIFDKGNFATEFKNCLEEDFVIKSIVPYDAYCENQYVVGSYVYYLEGKGELSGQKFMWVSTCIYAFDQDINLKKINQNGEFYDEDEIVIPFETNPREKIIEKISKLREIDHDRDTLSVMCNEGVQYTFDINIFGNSKHFFSGQIKGLSQFDTLRKLVCNVDQHMEEPIYVDVFEDVDDPSYDAIILRDCSKGKVNLENSEKEINFYHIVKYAFENGKLAKVVMFPSILSEAIPSPYDDIKFTDLTVRPKSEFV